MLKLRPIPWLMAMVILLCGSGAALAAPAHTAEEVEAALSRAKEYLYRQQQGGTWEHVAPAQFHGDQATGPTALAVYALLVAGEPPTEPRIAGALEYIRRTETTGVYALGLRCLIWGILPQTPENRQSMARDARLLLQAVRQEDPGQGHYNYNPVGRAYSHSRSNYAILGLWAASLSGFEIPQAYWEFVGQAWIRNQDPSGGWTYMARGDTRHPMTPGMTAAGVATLLIIQDVLNLGGEGRPNPLAPHIDSGVRWLVEHFDKVATDERYDRDWPYPTLFAVERVGVASGRKYFGDRDWYREGTAWLLKEQNRDGSWRNRPGGPGMSPMYNTCFGMLFLAYGRAPVIMNKLDYTVVDARRPANWNQRPRDVANVTRWISNALERTLNWQILDLEAPLVDLLDAPILYISGNQALNLGAEHKQKLREYVEHGGLILGNADGGSNAFAASFRRLGMELFPMYEFRELPADHPVYSIQFPRERWRTKPSVLGLSNGARELMLLLPHADAGRTWQSQLAGVREEPMWQLASNIFLYTVDREHLRYKDQAFLTARDTSISPQRTLSVARLEYPGNWNPEPGGWRRLADLMHNERQIELEVQPLKLGQGGLDDVQVAHITGTAVLELTEAQRETLRQFVQSGGTIVVDAAGGAAMFAQSAEAELNTLLPDAELKLLPAEHEVYRQPGAKIENVRYRTHAQKVLAGISRTPRLQGIEHDGRVAVFFSREDLSVGLVGHPVDGIIGYDPTSATALMQNILTYSAAH